MNSTSTMKSTTTNDNIIDNDDNEYQQQQNRYHTNNNNDNNNNKDNNNIIKWIIHGNIVVPVYRKNIFTVNSDDDNNDCEEEDEEDVVWLGPERFLKILLNHVVTVNTLGFIVDVIPARKFMSPININNRNNWNTTTCIYNESITKIIYLNLETEFVCPGLIDLHIHAPQYTYTGTATDRPLMGPNGWLETYTFPAESRLQYNIDHTNEIYNNVIQTTLKNGTTTAVYFSTIHIQPCQILIDCAITNKQRCIIGKVCMDRNSPDTYCQSTKQNIQETIKLIEYIHDRVGQRDVQQQPNNNSNNDNNNNDNNNNNNNTKIPLPLILPAVVPRFIPTCTPQLLQELGRIAKQYNCYITSHISESIDEVQYTQYIDQNEDQNNNDNNNNPIQRTDTDIFHSHNLITNQCIMAHAIYLTKKDIQLFQQMGCSIAHCPLSNFYFAGGILPIKYLIEQYNIHIGLGTDVAGGYNPSIFHSMRMAVIASRSLHHTYNFCNNNNQKQKQSIQQQHAENSTSNVMDDTSKTTTTVTSNTTTTTNTSISSIHDDIGTNYDPIIDYRHAFYMATIGGAYSLQLHNSIGTIQVGMEFDALILSATPPPSPPTTSPIHIYHGIDTVSDIFQKLCVLGDDRNITQIFVQGNAFY